MTEDSYSVLCMGVCVRAVRGPQKELIFSFHHVGTGDQTQLSCKLFSPSEPSCCSSTCPLEDESKAFLLCPDSQESLRCCGPPGRREKGKQAKEETHELTFQYCLSRSATERKIQVELWGKARRDEEKGVNND